MTSDADRSQNNEENGQPQGSRPLVVGIGASAGGLDALGRFFENVPDDTGMAFVVVQHLDPDYDSALPELLSRQSRVPVTKVEEDTPVAPDNVYVIAPNTMLVIQGGVLRPSTPAQTQSRRNVIDAFFESLAEDQDGYAVGIILSGSGSDGTLGLRAIKEAQGMTIAQEPGTADYDSMPQSAITSDCVDHVLTLEEMPDRLIQHVSHLAELGQSLQQAPIDDEDTLRRICAIVRERTGHDFTGYKESTLVRRIQRRLQVNRIESVSTYVQRLREDPREAELLQKELLIGVTSFFRDTEAFDTLQTEVIPRIFSERRGDGPVRVWVAGCSTGEEAYSIAILMAEQRRKTGSSAPVQVFATDIDEQALETARRGWYPQGIADQVSRQRLERYFIETGGVYQVSQEIREMCIFSIHNLLSDPPFSRIDLVSCRNLLIYLQADAQRRVLPLLHYALRPKGYLFLGHSENIAAHSDLFDVVSRPHHVFRRKEISSPGIGGFHLGQPYTPHTRPDRGSQPSQEQASRRRLGETFRRAILEEYAPAALVITESGEILEVSGQTQPYVQLAQGAFQNNLFTMLRGGLLSELRKALNQASMDRQAAVAERVAFRVDRELHYARLTVRPVDQHTDSRLFMVIFERDTPPEPSVQASPGDGEGTQVDAAVRDVENELRRTREELQATIEELETQGEEMKSANEELLSMNEELQSANEELQASKEELQSVNEELHTINGELNKKIEELNRANDDIENLLRSTNIAAIFLDMDLRIKQFTPVTRDIFPLVESDAGRPITDISSPFENAGWMDDIRSVTRSLASTERHVLAPRSGAWFIMRVLPYRTRTNMIDGTVVTFADVTELQRAELRAAELANIVESSNDAIISRRLDGTITTWNRSAHELLGYTMDEMLGESYLRLVPPGDVKELEGLQRRVLAEETPTSTDGVLLHKDGTPIEVSLSLSPLRGIEDEVTGFALITRGISERKRLEIERDGLMRELEEASGSKDEFMAMLGHEIRNPLATIASAVAILKEPDLFGADDMKEAVDILERQSRHLNRLVEDLLEVTRVSRRSIQLKQERIDIAAVARETARDYRPLCDSLGLKLELDVPHEPVEVWGDRDRLAQVFGNLLSNSCKFTPAGGSIFIQVSRAEDETASIVVRDTGAGVPAETLPNLFQPFQVSGKRENRGSSGLGLGLALVKGIVELHGGTVRAHSGGRGQGFTIGISLPVEQ